jgi:hypothetical protein
MLDSVEWIAREPRPHSEMIATWRTSRPRLTTWEDRVDRGYVVREAIVGFGLLAIVTEDGEKICARTRVRQGQRGQSKFRASRDRAYQRQAFDKGKVVITCFH